MRLDIDGCSHYAKNVRDAIKVAEKLKEEGQYDIFRGQIRNFPIRPSIFRPGVDQGQAIARLNKFAHWVHSTPELASMHRNKDAILAVAQHYGLNTTLLDFSRSPQIAGFFATDGELPYVSNSEFEPSCIICAKRRVLIDSWKDMNERSKERGDEQLVRVIDIDVRNLWRLQAQQGLFIDVRVDPTLLEMFSYFFRIFFPYKRPYRDIESETIYPKRRSHLEELFEEYLSHEKRVAGIARLEEMGFHSIPISREPFYGEVSAFKTGAFPPALPSWDSINLEDWGIEPDERHEHILSRNSIQIRFAKNEKIVAFATRAKKQILRAMKRRPGLRKVAIQWAVSGIDGCSMILDDESKEVLSDGSYQKIECKSLVELLWDGIRRLPYEDEQIASCIANYLSLVRYGWDKKESLFGEMIGVELAAIAAINRAMVSKAGVLARIRPDFFDLVTPEEMARYESPSSRAYEVLGALVDPKRLFEFEPFADLFVREVIPTQLWFRSEGNMIIFSPARIDIFGNS